MSKGLAVIYDPHNLYQFIWCYCTYGQDKKWDVLCLPNGFKGQYMSSYCEKSGIFDKIYTDDKDFLAVSNGKQLAIFIQMFGYALLFQQKRFCRKFLNNYVNIDDYDEINVMTDVGLVSGLCIGLSSLKKVVIMEDGIGDYRPRTYGNIFKNFFNLHSWKGFLLSVFGYTNIAHDFPLRTTKKCIKYSSHPEKMPYKKYLDHKKIFDFSETNMDLFECIVNHIYGDIKKYDFNLYDAVIFTEPFEDYFVNPEYYQKKLEDYICGNFKKVLIKKHPRDVLPETYNHDVDIEYFDQSIPAEVMIPYLVNKNLVFAPSSSIMLYLSDTKNTICCLYFNNVPNSDFVNPVVGNYPSLEKIKGDIKRYGLDKYSIIELE